MQETFDKIKGFLNTVVSFIKTFAAELKGFVGSFKKDISFELATTNPIVEPNTIE